MTCRYPAGHGGCLQSQPARFLAPLQADAQGTPVDAPIKLAAIDTQGLDALNRPQDRIGGSAFVNALLGWDAPGAHWGASLSVKNIFETKTPQAVTYTPSSGNWYFVTGDPRTALVTLSYKL